MGTTATGSAVTLNALVAPQPKIVAQLSPQPKIIAVTTGSIFTSGGGTAGVSSLTLSSPMSTGFTLSGSTGNLTLGFAPNLLANTFLRSDGVWATGSVTPQNLYNLLDVFLPQETATGYVLQTTTGVNLVTVLSNQITVTQNGTISPAILFPPGQQVASVNNGLIFTVVSATNYVNNAWRIIFSENISGWTAPQNPIVLYYPTTGNIPDGNVLAWSQSNKYWTNKTPTSAGVVSVQANTTGTATAGVVRFLAGTNTTLTQTTTANGLDITINASGGGGGGSFSSVAAKWTTANATNKNAYSSQPTINNDGITISLVATTNPGTLTAFTVTLNGVALTNTYTATGSGFNFTVTIPVADITGNAVQTASSVTVALANTVYNLVANSLTNTQPTAFNTALSASYAATLLPYYTTTSNVS